MKAKSILQKLTCWIVLLILSACGSDDSVIEEPVLESIELDRTSLTLAVAEKDTLDVITDIGDSPVTWESSNPEVASIDNSGGIFSGILAKKIGTTTITATVGDLTATCEIVVIKASLEVIELDKTSINLEVTDRDTLKIITAIEEHEVVWTSSNPEVASVSQNGELLALNSGTTTISVTADDVSATSEVIVDLTIFLGGSAGEFDAAYWKNGTINMLTTNGNDLGLYSWVNSIRVANGDIFAGGQKVEREATLWKNGEGINLEVGGSNEVNDLAVLDGNIIAVGGNNRIFTWTEADGLSYLTDGSTTSVGRSIFTHNSDIYIAGQWLSGTTYRPTVWKNGNPFVLDHATNNFIYDVFVNRTDFYTCATEYSGPGLYKSKIWKNDELTELTDGNSSSAPYAIYVHNSDVYVAGHKGFRPVIWKNGELIHYADPGIYGTAREIAFLGDDMYVVGNLSGDNSQVGIVWKNGEEIFRTELFDNAFLESIDVK